ncbi:MAG: hypothetical protein Q9209_000157 [Squamulea sp. 1 TL-2023]
MQLPVPEGLKPTTYPAAPGYSGLWLSSRSSPFQLRDRLFKAYTLLQYFPTSPLPQPFPTDPRQTPSTSEPSTPNLSPPPPPYLADPKSPCSSPLNSETPTTIPNLKYAHQSLSLLQTSLHESSENPIFARQLYIHALVYLLQGLPPASSLTEGEVASLIFALPDGLHLPSRTSNTKTKLNNEDDPKRYAQIDFAAGNENHPPPPQSLLHRALSTTIFFLIIFIQFLTPYIRSLFSAIDHYNREYNIQERTGSLLLAITRRSRDVLISSVDPGYLIWFAAEISAGVADGWRRGQDAGYE